MDYIAAEKGVNLPRWGLKRRQGSNADEIVAKCKFTPLGFETVRKSRNISIEKLCKFTPLGFETLNSFCREFLLIKCKFTPLGFETKLLQ